MTHWIQYKFRNLQGTHIQICCVIEDVLPSHHFLCTNNIISTSWIPFLASIQSRQLWRERSNLLVINLFEANIMYCNNSLLVYLINLASLEKIKPECIIMLELEILKDLSEDLFQFSATCWSIYLMCLSRTKEITWCAFSPYSCQKQNLNKL